MSVWLGAISDSPSLSGSEGALISVSVTVPPRDLEDLLEALAQLSFPVNPQIYHDAGEVYLYNDGHEETEPVTLVEFPAYEQRLSEINRLLRAHGFDPASVQAAPMLQEIHEAAHPEPAPNGAPYRSKVRVKHAAH